MVTFEAFVVNNPLLAIILISATMSLFSTLLMKHFTDQEHLKTLKKRQKELNKEIREATKKKETHQLEDLNKELVEISLTMMKSSFSVKMMLITFIPVILLFSWLRGIYNPATPDAVPLLSGWLWWYIGCAVVSSMIYRKLFNMA